MSDNSTETTPTEQLPATATFDTVWADEVPIEVASVPEPTPRIRWGSIIWGMITCAIAATTLVVVSSPSRRVAFLEWIGELSTVDYVAMGTVTFGVIILLIGIAALGKRAAHQE